MPASSTRAERRVGGIRRCGRGGEGERDLAATAAGRRARRRSRRRVPRERGSQRRTGAGSVREPKRCEARAARRTTSVDRAERRDPAVVQDHDVVRTPPRYLERWWLHNTTPVAPFAARCGRSARAVPAGCAGSSPSVGSSRNTTAGSLMSARAMPRRCLMPRLYVAMSELAAVGEARPRSSSAAARSPCARRPTGRTAGRDSARYSLGRSARPG